MRMDTVFQRSLTVFQKHWDLWSWRRRVILEQRRLPFNLRVHFFFILLISLNTISELKLCLLEICVALSLLRKIMRLILPIQVYVNRISHIVISFYRYYLWLLSLYVRCCLGNIFQRTNTFWIVLKYWGWRLNRNHNIFRSDKLLILFSFHTR